MPQRKSFDQLTRVQQEQASASFLGAGTCDGYAYEAESGSSVISRRRVGRCFQDGAEFYDDATGEHVWSAPAGMVAGDDHMEGAAAARRLFRATFPNATFVASAADATPHGPRYPAPGH